MLDAWQIIYADGTTFSDQDGNPEDAPGWGVLAVAQKDELVNAQIHHGSDFYCYAEQFGGWAGLDYFGLAQYKGGECGPFIAPGGHGLCHLGGCDQHKAHDE